MPDTAENHLVIFQEKAIRRTWHNAEWWFFVVDVCGVLTDSPDPGAWRRKLKQELGTEGSEPVGYERVRPIENPDLASARARELNSAKGYPQDWIEERSRSIAVRGGACVVATSAAYNYGRTHHGNAEQCRHNGLT